MRLHVLDDPNWQLGPSLFWRFAREDVDDRVVRHMHEIDDVLSLGVLGGYVWRDPADRRKQSGGSAWALGDVSGTYDGWTAGLDAFAMPRWRRRSRSPEALQPPTAAATTWTSISA